ncbi:MAG: iron-containing alcohol dehydrogenase [Vicinamibacteria bacterium]
MTAFDFTFRTRLVFGPGSLARLGGLARELGFRRVLLVVDHGLDATGHVPRAVRSLEDAGVAVALFQDFAENPDSAMVAAGAAAAAAFGADALVGLGGGSSLDCAKGIAFVATNGGTMADYRGYGKASRPLLPMIGVPTTAGTGSDAQSYALVSDAETHRKMACGDPGAAFKVALLDPELTLTLPASVTAVAGYDALSHAVETAVTTRRNALSSAFSREAFRLLDGAYERVLDAPGDVSARGDMLLGAFYAGLAVEASMLGAAHACANPLTARHGTTHGVAVGLMLPAVVRWNGALVPGPYAELAALSGLTGGAAALADRLEALAVRGGLPRRLAAVGIAGDEIPLLAESAVLEWTGTFNPRPLDAPAARDLYQTVS